MIPPEIKALGITEEEITKVFENYAAELRDMCAPIASRRDRLEALEIFTCASLSVLSLFVQRQGVAIEALEKRVRALE